MAQSGLTDGSIRRVLLTDGGRAEGGDELLDVDAREEDGEGRREERDGPKPELLKRRHRLVVELDVEEDREQHRDEHRVDANERGHILQRRVHDDRRDGGRAPDDESEAHRARVAQLLAVPLEVEVLRDVDEHEDTHRHRAEELERNAAEDEVDEDPRAEVMNGVGHIARDQHARAAAVEHVTAHADVAIYEEHDAKRRVERLPEGRGGLHLRVHGRQAHVAREARHHDRRRHRHPPRQRQLPRRWRRRVVGRGGEVIPNDDADEKDEENAEKGEEGEHGEVLEPIGGEGEHDAADHDPLERDRGQQ
mmetsp:Transcript_16479/g.43310  ORF Transcript_16479/g.43310 Transcript_16479/m.43310 type:complete len:307 (-) Transcript_16479:358-1278(-)